MAENTTSITVKVDIDTTEFKQKIYDVVREAAEAAITEVFRLFGVSTPIVEAETLAVGDRVKVVGPLVYSEFPHEDCSGWESWFFRKGDEGRLTAILSNGDAEVVFDRDSDYEGTIALTSLEKIVEPANRVDSLADADRTRKYTDASGELWQYGHSYGSTGWYWTDRDGDTGYGRDGHDTEYWGPFKLVAE